MVIACNMKKTYLCIALQPTRASICAYVTVAFPRFTSGVQACMWCDLRIIPTKFRWLRSLCTANAVFGLDVVPGKRNCCELRCVVRRSEHSLLRYVTYEKYILTFCGALHTVDFNQDGLVLGPKVTGEGRSLTADNVKHSWQI